MEDLLKSYTVTDIALFIVMLALAVKGAVSFLDWAKDRLRRVFDKEYAEKKHQSSLEQLIANKAETDSRLTHLQEVDKQILDELSGIRSALNEHIRVDDERNADSTREYILRFNVELIRDDKHTREDFIEVLSKIDAYESFCRDHEDYKNNRAVSAIANIKRVYDDRLRKRDFL